METFEFAHIRNFVNDTFKHIYDNKGIRFTVEYKYVPASMAFSTGFKKMVLILYKDGNYEKDFNFISMNIVEGYCKVLHECFEYLITTPTN